MNKLHKVIEAARKGELSWITDPNYDWGKDAELVLEHASAHAVCFDAGELEQIQKLRVIPEIVQLPFKTCWIEYSVKDDDGKAAHTHGWLCVSSDEHPECIKADMFLFAKGMWVYMGGVFIDGKEETIDGFGPDPERDDFRGGSAAAVCAFLSAINCKNANIVEEAPPKKLQAARERKGKQPLFSTWTLKIDIPASDKDYDSAGGSHASPRLHIRRRHQRQYAPGKWTWVQDCLVGRKSTGVVFKDYGARYRQDA